VIRDPTTQAIKGVFPQPFTLRTEISENYLSTYWMEVLSSAGIPAQFKAVLAALRKKHAGVKSKGAFAKLNAGLVLDAGSKRGLQLRIRDRSSANDPGYSGIFGMPLNNSDIEFLALLAGECCVEVRDIAEIDLIP
jgi:hypothetical protein